MTLKIGLAALAASLALAAQASQAGERCATRDEYATLKVAAVQQELMVAALTCHDIGAYNRFVISYRRELQRSDHAMLKLFIRREGGREGDAAYNAYKTRLANLSALANTENGDAFCANAEAEFARLLERREPLAEFALARHVSVSLPFDDCGEADARPWRTVSHHGVYDRGSDDEAAGTSNNPLGD